MNILEIRNLSKRFPGVVALDDIHLNIKKGKVCCIVGENGAGKSTFIKILTGALLRDEGKILFNGKVFNPKTTREALDAGIGTIFQELNVVEHLTVEQNLILGRESTSYGFIRKNTNDRKIFTILAELDAGIRLDQKVGELSVAQKQTIEIAKAVGSSSELIILDEPTAALSSEEMKRLHEIIKELKEKGMTAIYVTHRLDEIFEIGDELVVFRDGSVVAQKPMEDIGSKTEIIQLMLGKVVAEGYKPSGADYSEKVIEVSGICNRKLNDVSFSLFKGEIIGFYGLMGSGKTEIARAIYGLDPIEKGELRVRGRSAVFSRPLQAMRNGISMIPEERRTDGIFGNQTIEQNISVSNYQKISKLGFINFGRARAKAREYMEKLRIKARGIMQVIETLSGGNQQKVVVAKCLNAESSILLLDEPTRGIDVGGKEEIHNLIRELAAQGVSVIVFSSELPEVLNLCDRLFFLQHGTIIEEVKNSYDIDVDKIMKVVAGEWTDEK